MYSNTCCPPTCGGAPRFLICDLERCGSQKSHRGLPFGCAHRSSAVTVGLKVNAHDVSAHYPLPDTINLSLYIVSEKFVYPLAHLLNFNGWLWRTDLIVSQNPARRIRAPPPAKCRSICAAILDSAFPFLMHHVISNRYLYISCVEILEQIVIGPQG